MSNRQAAGTGTANVSSKILRYQFDQLKNTEKLYSEKKFADVWFSFESTDDDDNDGSNLPSIHLIPAHKILLAAASDVFEAMFFGQLKENGRIRMTDVSKSAFLEFLQFFYLNKVHLTDENIADVLYLGHKYNVTECVETCEQFLKDSLTNSNVCTILSLVILYDQEELMKLCHQRILLHTADVFHSVDFLECDRRVMEYILKQDLLSCTEVEVFDACMAWVVAKS